MTLKLCCFAAVQSLSHVQLFSTPRTAACQAFLSFTISWILLKLMSIESVMLSNHLTLWHSLLLLLSIFPSLRVFFNESALCIRWPKYWIFNFSVNPSNKHAGLNSFRINWSTFDENIHSYQPPCLLHQSLPHVPCLYLLPPCPAGTPGWPLP